jgi:2'-hydroxyisoflavone reductase
MRILVFGGTQFVGRHIVEAALVRGHELTLINRGKTGSGLFPDVPTLRLDRLDDLSPLHQQEWDVVIDVSAYVPRAVRMALEALKGRAKKYVFISTISVYDPAGYAGVIDEASAVIELEDKSVEEITADTYGGLKVLCERELESFDGEVAVLRPGIIVGPYDHTNRFHHWVRAHSTQTTVAAPERMNQPVQYIDGRDLADFTLHVAESSLTGTFNTCGPESPSSWDSIFASIQQTLGVSPIVKAIGFDELDPKPLVLPQDGSKDGIFTVSNLKAQRAGLTFRALSETIQGIADEIKGEVDQKG